MLRIENSMLNIMASILTPFLAYIPAVMLGGSGILATVVTGGVIGHVYATRFTPEFLTSISAGRMACSGICYPKFPFSFSGF